jgi:hypothetical protein
MSIASQPGPLIVFGQNPPVAGTNYQPDYNPDSGPSAFGTGVMMLDTRYGFRASLQAGGLCALGFYQTVYQLLVDQIPSAYAIGNVAGGALVTSGTPMTLVSVSGAGVMVSSAVQVMPVSGTVMPVGTHWLDSAPATISFGPNGSVQVYDPRTMLMRALSITASGTATGGVFICRGADAYGVPVTEQITAVTGSTITGQKGFKAVYSVTPLFTDAHNYSVGTSDVYEFPLQALTWAAVEVTYINTFIAASTGFVPASTISPATTTSGSTRGTYALQSAANGTNRLQLAASVPAQSAAASYGPASLFGVLNNAS